MLDRPPLGSWWLPLVDSVNPWHSPGASTQGSYVVGADGRGYAYDNYNRDARRLNMLLDRGLTAFRAQPPQRVTVPAALAGAGKPPAPPAGVTVVRVFCRIRPLSPGAPEGSGGLGREHMWVYPDDVRQLLQAADRSPRDFALPAALGARMLVFHVIDNTRGQAMPWRPEEITRLNLRGSESGSAGGRRRLLVNGDFGKRSVRPPFSDRGHEGRVEGEIEIDAATARVVRFRMLWEGQAWTVGGSQRPPAPAGRYPFVVAMIETDDPLSRVVPPEAAETGDWYARPRLP